MTVFLDTDVLIDCLRGLPPALDWLTGAASETFQVPGIVAMELVVGCRDRADLERTQRFVEGFDVVWPEAGDFYQAYELLAEFHLASNLGHSGLSDRSDGAIEVCSVAHVQPGAFQRGAESGCTSALRALISVRFLYFVPRVKVIGFGDYPYLTAEGAESAERSEKALLSVLCVLCGEGKRCRKACVRTCG